MANYSEAQLSKNRRSIGTTAVVFNALLFIWAALSSLSFAEAIVLSLISLAVAAATWWLFAAERAGTIDESWVDGWNDQGETGHIAPTTLADPLRQYRPRSGRAQKKNEK